MSRYRWTILALGTLAQASYSAVFLGIPVMAPQLRDEYGLSLPEVGVVLAAIYMLWAYQRAFQGPGAERHRGLVDLLPREVAAIVPVVAVMLVLGVYPNLVLDRINPSSAGVVAWVRSVDVDQAGLPGGLRAQLPPPDDADVSAVAEGAP